jgi:translation initiation factor 1 (eIF-1/SUI1)
MNDVATGLNTGMATIASGLVTLQTMLADQTALIQDLKDDLATGGAITQEQLDTLGASADTMQTTLTEALGHEQAIEGMLRPQTPPVPPTP